MNAYIQFRLLLKVAATETELLLLALLGPFLLFANRIIPPSFYLVFTLAPLFICCVFRVYHSYRNNLQYQKQIFNHPLLLIFALFILDIPIAIWVSVDRTTAQLSAGNLLWSIALCDALIRSPVFHYRPQWTTTILLLNGIVILIFAPLLATWKTYIYLPPLLFSQLNANLSNFLGETIHANVLAGALIILLPLCYVTILSLMYEERTTEAYYYKFLLIGMIILLILSQSRGAFLAFLIEIWAIILTYYVKKPFRWMLGGILISIILVIVIQHSNLMNQFKFSIFSILLERTTIWQSSLNAITHFPFTGIGIGNFINIMSTFYPSLLDAKKFPHAHNLFLQIALDLGLPGLIGYLALLFNATRMVTATIRQSSRHTRQHWLAIGTASSLAGMLAHGLLDAVTWGTKLSFLPWLLFALITQLFYQNLQQRPHSQSKP